MFKAVVAPKPENTKSDTKKKDLTSSNLVKEEESKSPRRDKIEDVEKKIKDSPGT